MPDSAPYQYVLDIQVPPSAAAADYMFDLAGMSYAGFVKSVAYIPNAAIVGAGAPNNRTLRVVNVGAGANGGGVAATANLDGTNNVAANAPLNILSGPAPNYTPRYDPGLNYANENPNTGQTGSASYTPPVIALTPNSFQAGDVLQFQSLHTGTGVADPGGMLLVTVERAGNV